MIKVEYRPQTEVGIAAMSVRGERDAQAASCDAVESLPAASRCAAGAAPARLGRLGASSAFDGALGGEHRRAACRCMCI